MKFTFDKLKCKFGFRCQSVEVDKPINRSTYDPSNGTMQDGNPQKLGSLTWLKTLETKRRPLIE